MKKYLKFMAGFVLFSLLFTCLAPQPVLGQVSGESVLHMTITPPSTLDPGYTSNFLEWQVINELFAGLVRDDPETGATIPDLAESWTWNLEKTEVTFNLRDGLLWSDGEPLTADDVRFAILRALDPADPKNMCYLLYPILNAEEYNQGIITDPDEVGVFVDSPTQVRFQLESPMVFFDKVLTQAIARPLPEHIITAHPDDWTSPEFIATSAPFTITRWTGQDIILNLNPNYYGIIPDFEVIHILIADDSQVNWNAYLLGNLDTFNLSTDQVEWALADPILADQVDVYATSSTYVLAFRAVEDSPFINADVRKAFIAAVDRDDLAVLTGGIVTLTYTAPGVFGSIDPGLGIGIPYDETAAQAYLTAAGYPGGSGFPDTVIQVFDSPINQLRWNFLVDAWQTVLDVPITVEYVSTTPPVQPISFIGWAVDYDDAYNFLYDGVNFNRSTGRIGDWVNQEYDDIISQVPGEEDSDARILLYQQAEQILVEDDAILGPMINPRNMTLTKPYLDRTFSAFHWDTWYNWELDLDVGIPYNPLVPLLFAPPVDTLTYEFPIGLFADPQYIIHTVLRPHESIFGVNTPLTGIGHAFRLEASLVPPKAGLNDQTLVPYTLHIFYSDEQLIAASIQDESSLELYARVGDAWVAQPSTVDALLNELTVTTQEINTDFVVLGQGPYITFLPTVLR